MQIDIPDPLPLMALLEKAERGERFSDSDLAVSQAWISHMAAERQRYMKLADFQAALRRKMPAVERLIAKAPSAPKPRKSDTFWAA